MWRLLCEKESFWGSLLLRKYGILNLDTLLGGGYPIKGSRWWCDILKSCELLENGLGWFQKNISRVIGDGREVSFWRAKWVSGETLCRSFNRVFLISEQKDSMIAEVGT